MNQFAILAPIRAHLAEEQEDLAADLIENIDRFSVAAIETPELAAEALEWLRVRSEALIAVMGDEFHQPRGLRDVEWLAGASEVLSMTNALRGSVGRRLAVLRGAA